MKETRSKQSNKDPLTTQAVVKEWPGAFGVYRASAQAIKFNLQTHVVLGILILVTSLLSNTKSTGNTIEDMFSPVAIVGAVLSIILSVALTASLLASVRSQKFSMSDAISKGLSMLAVRYAIMSAVMAGLLAVSFLLLIVPFFFVLPRLLLSEFYLIDKNMGPIESIKASWKETKGHSFKVWDVIGVTVLMAIGILVLVGFYFLFMFMAAWALLYLHISSANALPVEKKSGKSALSK